MDLTKKRWIILLCACFINLCIGSLYAWSVFASPVETLLAEKYGRTLAVGSTAVVFVIANAVGPFTMIPGGKIHDTFGPRKVLLAGAFVFGGGMFASGFATDIPMLMLSYGLGCGLGMGMIYGCTVSNSVKFFPDKKGLVGGIATASYGISSVIIPPIARLLISECGVMSTFRIFGAVSFIVIFCGAFVIEKCPEGFMPKESSAKALKSGKLETGPETCLPVVRTDGKQHINLTSAQVGGTEYTWKEMLKSPLFYLMLFMLTCGATGGTMCISQASGIAQAKLGLSVNSAAAVVSILALFNTGGRVLSGLLSDKIGRSRALLIGMAVSLGGMVLLYFSDSEAYLMFYTGISAVGFSFGTVMGIYPAFTAEQFGVKNNSVNYGIMFIGFALAGYIGPTVMKELYSVYGEYDSAFLVAGGIILLGIIIILAFEKIRDGSAAMQLGQKSGQARRSVSRP